MFQDRLKMSYTGLLALAMMMNNDLASRSVKARLLYYRNIDSDGDGDGLARNKVPRVTSLTLNFNEPISLPTSALYAIQILLLQSFSYIRLILSYSSLFYVKQKATMPGPPINVIFLPETATAKRRTLNIVPPHLRCKALTQDKITK